MMTLDYQLSMGISGWFYADIEYPASLSLSLCSNCKALSATLTAFAWC